MTLLYLYAVFAGPAPEAAMTGIDEQPVRWVTCEDLVGAVSSVSEDDFGEEGLNAGLADMNWLGPRAVAHQDVNQWLHEQSEAMIPLAFGTVFRDEARVVTLLREQHTELRKKLEAVRGRAEWVVAVHRVDQPTSEALQQQSPSVHALHAEVAAASPGRAHLLRRQLAQLERDELRRLDVDTVNTIEGELRDIGDAVYVEPLPADAVERPLLRASVLIQRTKDDEFLRLIGAEQQRWQSLGYRILLNGPWPPYRFGGLTPS